ncbi:hypothetical protein ACS5PU_06135 [Pedobacter sp. GSP4]|uniref:hypothetical protein n=1 Tax=Pedobacter sp. GSP4 TaxID=3453716 RepID=UPI003EEE1F59
MSIYFQFPAIDEYPNVVYPLQEKQQRLQENKNEDSINPEQIIELKDFLALKPV